MKKALLLIYQMNVPPALTNLPTYKSIIYLLCIKDMRNIKIKKTKKN